MANIPTQAPNGAKDARRTVREHKFLLKQWFTPASVTPEPEEVLPVVTAGLREAHVVKEYPDGYFKRVTAVFRGEMSTLLKAVLFLIAATLPFILALTVGLHYFEQYVMANSYNFMGAIGVGYPGGGDSISQAVARLYWDVDEPIVCTLVIAALIASLFMAGFFYCAKRTYFQNSYKKIVRTFFMGVKKYWWKFMVTVFVGSLIACAMATSVLYLLAQNTAGNADAGAWCACIFTMIIGAPMLLVPLMMIAQFTVYDLSFGKTFKNAIVMILNCPVTIVAVGVVSAVPLVLMCTPMIGKIIVYVIAAFFGLSFWALALVSLAKRSMDKCTAYNIKETQKLQVIKRQSDKVNAPKTEKKKKVAPQPYQNPKKKKKK